jgi:hypothetical protein
MSLKRTGGERFSLSRWSRRKLESALESTARTAAPSAGSAPSVPAAAASAPPAAGAAVELPPVESLTFESDFTAFLRPDVDAGLKRAALKQLFRDPRFNVMDGLDTYIGDYTKADPIPPEMICELIERFDFGDPASSAAATAPSASRAEAMRQGKGASAAAAASEAPAPRAGAQSGDPGETALAPAPPDAAPADGPIAASGADAAAAPGVRETR